MAKAILFDPGDSERRKKIEVMAGIDGISMTELLRNLVDFGWDSIYQDKIKDMAHGLEVEK